VDLAALSGIVPALAPLPTLLYFHENQFDYRLSESAHASIEPEIVNLYSALATQQLVFNSDDNRRTFLSGARALLRKIPDAVPGGMPE
jgi:hypothetical protein